jgi:hypothetical protein
VCLADIPDLVSVLSLQNVSSEAQSYVRAVKRMLYSLPPLWCCHWLHPWITPSSWSFSKTGTEWSQYRRFQSSRSAKLIL